MRSSRGRLGAARPHSRVLALLLPAVLFASCVHAPASSAGSGAAHETAAPGGPPAPAPANGTASPSAPDAARARLVPVQLTTRVTRVASFVHFVDSLAGTSGGKSIPTYRGLWNERIGPPTEEDLRAFEAFRASRRSGTASERCPEPFPGSVNARPGWSSRFLYASLEAEDTDAFLASAAPCLTEEESQGLAAALARFEPGFESFWRESDWLRAFDRDFQEFLQTGGLPLYLGEVARWFGVDPAQAPAPVVSFVLLPAGGGTHAQELGRRLLVEIRPHDAPTDQISVVAHEESHYLFYQIPPQRMAALEARADAAGPNGARVWLLLHEAIPTALGQGLAVARLQRGAFRPDASWYHIAEIDILAHLIYPLVRDGVSSGRTIDGDFVEACVREYDRWREQQDRSAPQDRSEPEQP